MRWVIVPEPAKPRTIEGEMFDVGDKEKKKKIDSVTLHRYLMDYVVGEVRIEVERENTPAAMVKQYLKISGSENLNQYEGLKRIGQIDRAFKNAKPGDIVGVEPDTWTAVCTIIREKSWAQAQHFGFQTMPLSDAWLDAKDEKAAAEKLRDAMLEKPAENPTEKPENKETT